MPSNADQSTIILEENNLYLYSLNFVLVIMPLLYTEASLCEKARSTLRSLQ